MKKKYTFENIEYDLIEEFNEGYSETAINEKITDYFLPFDYIVGDWAYGKLRLKGFYESQNSNVKKINNIENIKEYLKNYCVFNCKYFILKKSIDNQK